MLSKLMKHEYKATARFFLPAYGIFAALLVVQRLSMLAFDNLGKVPEIVDRIVGFTTGLFSVLTVLGFIGLVVCPMVYAVIRFWRNMIGDEGYLTHTLPVSTGRSIMAKFLVGGSWELVTFLVTILLGILYALSCDAGSVGDFFAGLGRVFSEGWQALGGWLILLLVLIVLSVLAQVGYNFMAAYSAMSMGQTANRHKLLASAGIYVGISFATTSVVQILMIALGTIFGSQLMESFEFFMITSVGVCQFVCCVLAICLVFNVLMAALHFFLGRHFLRKKLNLA